MIPLDYTLLFGHGSWGRTTPMYLWISGLQDFSCRIGLFVPKKKLWSLKKKLNISGGTFIYWHFYTGVNNSFGSAWLFLAKQLDIPYVSPPAVLTGSYYLSDYLTLWVVTVWFRGFLIFATYLLVWNFLSQLAQTI